MDARDGWDVVWTAIKPVFDDLGRTLEMFSAGLRWSAHRWGAAPPRVFHSYLSATAVDRDPCNDDETLVVEFFADLGPGFTRSREEALPLRPGDPLVFACDVTSEAGLVVAEYPPRTITYNSSEGWVAEATAYIAELPAFFEEHLPQMKAALRGDRES